jgi:hypothetical protein
MRTTWAARVAVLVLLCALAAAAAMAHRATAGSSTSATPAAPTSRVAGTMSTRVVVDHFRAIGRKVVGVGTAYTTFVNTNGVKSFKRKHFWASIRARHGKQSQMATTTCQILYLEIGEVDLTLAGLHAWLRAADPTQPIQLRLQADDTGGILGKLFCQLAQSQSVLATKKQAIAAARQMTRHVHRVTVLRASATIYAPNHSAGASTGSSTSGSQQALADECPVLHLVLGPVHLELLGLIADLNKVILDLTAVPGTLLGNIFCELVSPPPPPPPAPARASAG